MDFKDLDALLDFSVPEKHKDAPQLGQYLLDKGLINRTQLELCLHEQQVTKERLGLILSRNGFVTRDTLVTAILATNPHQIYDESIFTYRVPPEILLATRSMVTAERKGEVYIATLNSEMQTYVDIKGYYPDKEIRFTAANVDKIDGYLDQLQRMSTNEDSLVDKLLRRAFAEEISDIHIVPTYNSYTILARHLGVRRHYHTGTLDEFNMLLARIKDLSRMDMAERRIPQDGGFSIEFNGKMVDLRTSTLPMGNSEYAVLRLLDSDKVNPTLEGLGITNVHDWRKGVSLPDGMCLICGPTGSGKSTTLYATLRELDRIGKSIFSLEDPVEYRLPYIAQISINPTVGLDYSRGLRGFMRTDPDIIILGEIRDTETARNAVKAAETGHLLMGTLHTRSIKSTADRLRDLDIPAEQLIYILRAILVQRLIRMVCTHCRGEGCAACNRTGYAGRTTVSECVYFRNERDVQRMLDGETFWKTMEEDALDKLESGITNVAEVIRTFGERGAEMMRERGYL